MNVVGLQDPFGLAIIFEKPISEVSGIYAEHARYYSKRLYESL